MKIRWSFTLLSLLLVFSLAAQEDKEEKVEETTQKDFSRKAMMNDGRVENALVSGGAYYISNPAPTYEIDMNLVYHQAAWQASTIELLDGSTFTAKARYRVLDQKFEVLVDGEAYELDNARLLKITVGDQRFALLPDFQLKEPGRLIYQVHYRNENREVLERHHAKWQDPPQQNMFDTREQHRTVRRSAETYFRDGGEVIQLKNNKELVKILGLPKKGDAADYIKAKGLKLQHAADAAELLNFLDNF